MHLARPQSDRSQGPLSFPLSARDSEMENSSHGVWSPTTHSSLADPVTPGLPRPDTFRPQGLITLSTICSPPGLVLIRRTGQRSWGSPFRALLLPTGGTPLRATPLLSFHRPRFRGNGCDFRGFSGQEGERKPLPQATTTAEPCPPGFLPLQGLLLRRLGTGFPVRAPLTFPTGSAPYVSTSRRGSRGL
jgi:hypothetical protein